MTASGSPRGDDRGPEQEGIWEERSGASSAGPTAADLDTDVAETSSERASDRLARRLTSTVQDPGPAGLVYADVPNRVLALIIDIIALSVIGFALAGFFGGLVTPDGAIDSSGGQLDIAAFALVLLLQLVLSFAYFGGLWTLVGATLGMRLLGLRIGGETEGDPISWRQSLVRWLLLGVPSLLSSLAVYVPNSIGLILGTLGVAWLLLLLYTMAQSATKQGLHDRYGGTIVVKARRRAR